MQIRRRSVRVATRRRPASGCLSFVLVLGIMAGTGVLVWDWLAPYFSPRPLTNDEHRAQMQSAFAAGDFDASLEAAQTLLAANPDDYQAHVWRIRALVYRSYVDFAYDADRARALQASRSGYQRHADDPLWQAIHAYTMQINGQSIEASRLALTVIDQNPDSVPARLALAGAYGGQGIFEAALRDASKAVELANRGVDTATGIDWRIDALRAVAVAFSDLGRYDEARQTINRALTLNPRLIPLHFESALFAQQVGDADTATADYFKIIAFDADNAKARLRLCEVSSRLGEAAALDYCQQATQLAPAWWRAWYQLGREYYLRGDYTQAQRAMNRCTTLQVIQDVPIAERELDCWYIQGQSAEVRGDCAGLLATYDEFQAMRAAGNLAQVWTYPPEGPTICLNLTQSALTEAP